MPNHQHKINRISGWLIGLFVVSFIIISFVGAYLGVKGNKVPYTHFPTQPYEEVSFPTEARDKLTLGGWFFPANSDQVIVIVHGWGGHRARFLNLAEYLQRQNLNVLTFDLRGGTGRNTCG